MHFQCKKLTDDIDGTPLPSGMGVLHSLRAIASRKMQFIAMETNTHLRARAQGEVAQS
jgi:hypothetical protein